MSVQKLDQSNFESVILKGTGPALVDFYADWCGPCKMVSPIVDEIAVERPDLTVCKVNVDEAPGVASLFRVMSIPTLIFFRDGKPVAQAVGTRPKAQILKMLEQ